MKQRLVQTILSRAARNPKEKASAFAPANIALIKYWGKREQELNLPITDSLSKSLSVGTHTTLSISDEDAVWLNDTKLAHDTPFAKRLFAFCDLFRPASTRLHIHTTNEIPTGAGLASSASGFAALTLALNELFGWQLDAKNLSLLARLGSGSACRSLFEGFVQWHAGSRPDGLDSFAEPLDLHWPELQIGLRIVSAEQKPIDSRRAMQNTVATSSLYGSWPAKVAHDLVAIKEAIRVRDFEAFGSLCETNSLAMHATMIASSPPILYWLPETVAAMHQVWQWRKEGLAVYFTMDAGPNLKLLFLATEQPQLLQYASILPVTLN